VNLWIEEIKKEGGKGMFLDQVGDNESSFLVAWCTAFQLKVRKSQENRFIYRVFTMAYSTL